MAYGTRRHLETRGDTVNCPIPGHRRTIFCNSMAKYLSCCCLFSFSKADIYRLTKQKPPHPPRNREIRRYITRRKGKHCSPSCRSHPGGLCLALLFTSCLLLLLCRSPSIFAMVPDVLDQKMVSSISRCTIRATFPLFPPPSILARPQCVPRLFTPDFLVFFHHMDLSTAWFRWV